MTDRDLLELIVSRVGNLTTQVDTLTKNMAEVKFTMAAKQELAEVKAIVVKIENNHGQKLGALLDG